ncbi:hypothetical protein GLAREA_06743 [Glarea lozoyensis ATCC 20868]|uniref:SRP9 domain-containing protein n=1 Tax=Glarea lozoyensis (strain ATCC 20868 / MF5171) TaxID=1116229 RepID=S3D7J8_GLAL2|nr:uncharacterized protein GLAREA_06743 [Glarea lozoyensis ATCC 20868]EPE33730.1 hypothetical protein GLAREA_06743 [Glarea lozoyensis ATCC 20868]
MPNLPTAQEWLTQSTLLLQARPSTTRITTKYSHPRRPNPLSKPKPTPSTTTPSDPTTAPSKTPTSTLTLKTYDPISGATLKYTTDKAQEVGRLIQILGRLARGMAGLEMKEEEVVVKKEEGVEEVGTPGGEVDRQIGGAKGPAGGGGGGKKKKGKGKK